MSLYWCVWVDGRELDGVDAGSYADYHALRRAVVDGLEGGRAGARFPTLVLHSDCDGEWTAAACVSLEAELATIIAELQLRPPESWSGCWQRPLADAIGLHPRNAFESFLDADGAFLLQRLRELAELAHRWGQPILFQ